jgi:hypothetical protein
MLRLKTSNKLCKTLCWRLLPLLDLQAVSLLRTTLPQVRTQVQSVKLTVLLYRLI